MTLTIIYLSQKLLCAEEFDLFFFIMHLLQQVAKQMLLARMPNTVEIF